MERKKSRKISKQDKKYVVKNVQKRTQKYLLLMEKVVTLNQQKNIIIVQKRRWQYESFR